MLVQAEVIIEDDTKIYQFWAKFWVREHRCFEEQALTANNNYFSLVSIQLQELLDHPAFEVEDAVVECVDLINIIVVKIELQLCFICVGMEAHIMHADDMPQG